MLKRILLCALALLAALTASAAALQREQQVLSSKLIRLHVVASSDSERDQWEKLRVRDAVLAAAEGMNPEELERSLPRLQEAAQACLKALGSSSSATVTLGREHFPTRLYPTFTLPAGVYRAVRVTIGRGEGHNWWCVVFPSICLRASAEELEAAAVSAGFTQQELSLITAEGGYVLKLKCMQWLDTLKQLLHQ